MSSFSAAAAGVVSHLGMVGIGVGVFLNGLGVPGLSEVLVPLGGLAVARGTMNGAVLFVVVMVCQLVGMSLAYGIARYGGLPLVERYGKYILISSRELNAAQKAFDKYGSWLVLFGSFVPGIQGFMGYVAGVAQMNPVRFLISAFFGKLVWIGGLMYLGSVLGNNLDLIDRSIKQIGLVVLALVLALGVWYVYSHRRRQVVKKEN